MDDTGSGSVSHGVNILDIIIFSTTPIHSNIMKRTNSLILWYQCLINNWPIVPKMPNKLLN